MASRKTTKKQLPMDLPLTKRIARRMAPPSGFDSKMMRSEINYNRATHPWIRYQLLLYLQDHRWGTAKNIARKIGITERVAKKHLSEMVAQGAVKLVVRRMPARKIGIEHYRKSHECYGLTQKAKNAIKAERKVMAGE
jgi:DNA-binding MarR family transcriptional regulator